jgi:preprotein translocase subunit YajC
LQEDRNLLMVVFMLRVVFTVIRRQIARMAKYWNFV